MRRGDLVIPGRIGKDYNSICHFWTFEDLTGVPQTSFDMFFGTLLGGTTGMNPVMDRLYKLENIGVMLRHISPTNPVVTIGLRRSEAGSASSTFVFTPTNRVGGTNKFCGKWSNARARSQCLSYNIHPTVAAPGIAFVQLIVKLTWRLVSDAT